MATKRSYTFALTGGTTQTVPAEHATAVLAEYEQWRTTGFPKTAKWVEGSDEDNPGVIHYINFDHCVCDAIATPAQEEIDDRPCEQIDCIPDAGPANVSPELPSR